MKIKVAELTGVQLDYWLAKSCGLDATLDARIGYVYMPKLPQWCDELTNEPQDWEPSTNPAQGQTIIEREHIATAPCRDPENGSVVWFAWVEGDDIARLECADGYFERSTAWHKDHGPTQLIAAMRAKVSSVYGDEVEV